MKKIYSCSRAIRKMVMTKVFGIGIQRENYRRRCSVLSALFWKKMFLYIQEKHITVASILVDGIQVRRHTENSYMLWW